MVLLFFKKLVVHEMFQKFKNGTEFDVNLFFDI